jgi:hypothetical protein
MGGIGMDEEEQRVLIEREREEFALTTVEKS